MKKEVKGNFHTSDLTKVRLVPEVSYAREKASLVRENKALVRTLDVTAT